jgi:hypothetical protein
MLHNWSVRTHAIMTLVSKFTGIHGSLPTVTTQVRCPCKVKQMLQETDNDVISCRQTLILIILGHVGAVMRFAAALDL